MSLLHRQPTLHRRAPRSFWPSLTTARGITTHRTLPALQLRYQALSVRYSTARTGSPFD